MRLANISNLTSSEKYIQFKNKFKFEDFYVNDMLYLFNSCTTIEIYNFITEETLYMEFYRKDMKEQSNVDRLLSVQDKASKQPFLSNYKNQILEINKKNELNNSEKNREIIEAKFNCYLELLNETLEGFLKCENSKDLENLFDETFYINKERVKKAKMEFLKTRKSRFLLDDDIL